MGLRGILLSQGSRQRRRIDHRCSMSASPRWRARCTGDSPSRAHGSRLSVVGTRAVTIGLMTGDSGVVTGGGGGDDIFHRAGDCEAQERRGHSAAACDALPSNYRQRCTRLEGNVLPFAGQPEPGLNRALGLELLRSHPHWSGPQSIPARPPPKLKAALPRAPADMSKTKEIERLRFAKATPCSVLYRDKRPELD